MSNKYKTIFDQTPVAIMEFDYSPLNKLLRQLREQTVTNVQQFLLEHPHIVKKTFQQVKLLEANQAALRLYAVASRENLFMKVADLWTSNAGDMLARQFAALIDGKKKFHQEFKYKAPGKPPQDILLTMSVADGSPWRVLVVSYDISGSKKLESQLRRQAQLDGLTKLLNHNTVKQRLEEELARAKRYGLSLACLMIDLDHFKTINDKFGHQRGDQILKKVASMIKNSVRNVDLVGRYGGDEFLIILPETKTQNARFAAVRIHNLFNSQVFKYHKEVTHISLSIGITGYPSEKIKDCGTKDLIALADKAMYTAKKAGRNQIASL